MRRAIEVSTLRPSAVLITTRLRSGMISARELALQVVVAVLQDAA